VVASARSDGCAKAILVSLLMLIPLCVFAQLCCVDTKQARPRQPSVTPPFGADATGGG
jgi:hypothetical protein